MDSAAVPHGVPMDKGNNSSESKMDKSVANEEAPVSLISDIESLLAHENKEEERLSYTPLSFFYTKSTVYLPCLKKRNSYPSPSPSKIDIYLANVSKTYIPLSFFTTIVSDTIDMLTNSYESKMGLIRQGNTFSESESKMIRNYIMGNNFSESLHYIMGNKSESKMISRNYVMGNKSSESKVGRNYIMGKMISRNYIMGNKSSEPKVSRNSIPDDLALSILSKLPIKSLKRFGCVRKSWSVLFENSDFMTMYTNHFISCPASDSDDYHTFILSCHFHLPLTPPYHRSEFHLLDNRVQFNLPPLFQLSGYPISILGSTSVNGIFCLGQSKNEVQYILWNPATEEFRVIPRSPAELSPQHPQNNLYLRHVFHGFGYDQVRDDFKVIQYVSFHNAYYPPQSKYFFEIYSLKSNSWRMIDMDNDLSDWSYSQSFAGLEVYLDGACHWLVSKPNRAQRIELTLLSFDLSDEVFLITPIGEEPLSPYTFQARLVVLNGSIALISNYDDDIIFHISILGELGVSESWIKLYIYGPLPSIKWPPIGFGKTGYLFFKNKDGELAYVDLKTQIIEKVGITSGMAYYFMVGLYMKNLLSIGGSSN